MPYTLPQWGVSTKELHYEDEFARLIAPDFVDLVDPRTFILYQHDLLTLADEDRVVACQSTHGRVEASKLLLALICQRGNWVAKLQEVLRDRHIRLGHLADRIDDLQREVRMEVDFPDNAASEMLMEVDAEPFVPTTDSRATLFPHPTQAAPPLSPLTPPTTRHPTQPPPPPLASSLSFLDPTVSALPAPARSAQAPLLQQAGFPDLLQRMVSGQSLEEVPLADPRTPGPGRVDIQDVINEIARHFFTRLAGSVEDVPMLISHLERIAHLLITGYAVGCLEFRLRFATSHDLRQLRRLVESGVLQDAVERAVLSEERRDWLKKEVASHGLSWRQMKLKVTVKSQDLDRCEIFLKVREEIANPMNAVEALLQKARVKAARGAVTTTSEDRTEMTTTEDHVVHTLPDLLLAFLEWLLHRHPVQAEDVAAALAPSTPLTTSSVLTEAMTICCRSFILSNQLEMRELEKDLGHVAFSMLYDAVTAAASGEAVSQETQATETPYDCSSSLCVEAPPESPLASAVHRLVESKLMVPLDVADKNHVFRFASAFVADFALVCASCHEDTPEDYISRVLQAGSHFVVLHLMDLLMNVRFLVGRFRSGFRKLEQSERTLVEKNYSSISQQLFNCMTDSLYPRAVTELYLASYSFLENPEDFDSLFQRWQWQTFQPEWKHQMQRVLGHAQTLPDILLCPLSAEEMDGLRETAQEVLSAKHTVDLTKKLRGLSECQLRVILACVQLTNVASFSLVKVGPVAALRVQPGEKITGGVGSFRQPALKLCENQLGDTHVECLLRALPGMESVSHFDLSLCTIARHNLQRLLNHLCMRSVKTLVLNGISFSDPPVPTPTLPRFSHLKRLRAIELGCLGLEDAQMPDLAQQLRQLSDLRELTLEENPITTEGLSQLTPALAPCASLRALRLQGCRLDAGGAFVLGALLTPALSLHVLNLSRCPLLDSGLQHLSFLLGHQHTLLSKVSLREGGYSPAGLTSFFSYLRKCPRMQHLELGRCALEEEGMDVSDQLLKALVGSHQWDYLGLWQCRLGHTTFLRQLPATLTVQLQGVTSLVLQDNDLNDVHVGHLADAVRGGVLRHLRHLNLRQNNIGKAGAHHLAGVLRFLPHMSELLVQNSAVPADGAVSLARGVLPLPDMTLLDLSDSYGMGQFDVSDIFNQIANIVRDGEGIVIGSGVGYTDGDSSADQSQFLTEKLQLFSHGEEGGKPKGDREKKPLIPPFTRVSDTQIPPKLSTEELVGGGARVRRREITGRDMDTLVFDDVLRIILGHH